METEIVTPIWNPNIRPTEPEWSRTVELEHGLAVTITAEVAVDRKVLPAVREPEGPRPRT